MCRCVRVELGSRKRLGDGSTRQGRKGVRTLRDGSVEGLSGYVAFTMSFTDTIGGASSSSVGWRLCTCE